MAFVLRSAVVKIDGTDVSTLVRDVSIEMTYDSVDVTSMGAVSKSYSPGLRDDKITLNAYSSFAASGLHSIVGSKFASSGTVSVQIWANENGAGSTTGTANPVFTASCRLMTYNPLAGAVGDAAMTPLELPLASGTISIATA
jgi:hypothetical protein